MVPSLKNHLKNQKIQERVINKSKKSKKSKDDKDKKKLDRFKGKDRSTDKNSKDSSRGKSNSQFSIPNLKTSGKIYF